MASFLIPTRGVNDEEEGHVAKARALHMKILLGQFESKYRKLWSDQPSKIRPCSFVNFVLPLLMYYGAGDPLQDDLDKYPWLASCVASSTRHEDARVFHQDPFRNIEVLENFLKLQFCKVFGSHLLQNDPTCCIIYLLYNDVLEKKTGRHHSKDGSLSSSKAGEVVTEINEADCSYMENRYGGAWRGYYERARTEEPSSEISSGSSLECELHEWSWFPCSEASNGSFGDEECKDVCESMKPVMRQVVTRFLNQPGNHIKTSHLDINESAQYTSISCQLVAFCRHFEALPDSWSPRKGAWETWKKTCHTDSRAYSQWKQVVHKLGQFCLAAGSPAESIDNPFQSLQYLRDTLSHHLLYTADLHKRIFDLQTQIYQQKRSITAMAYRGVIERISADEDGKGSTQKWKNFLNHRVFFDNDKNDKGNDHEPGTKHKLNPKLNEFLEKHQKGPYGQQRIREMTGNLYSTLSSAIHNILLTGEDYQYDVDRSQFDPVEVEFLLALKPLADNVTGDGSVDWGKEQRRYPNPPQPDPNPPRSGQSKKMKAKLPSDLCAPEPDMSSIDPFERDSDQRVR